MPTHICTRRCDIQFPPALRDLPNKIPEEALRAMWGLPVCTNGIKELMQPAICVQLSEKCPASNRQTCLKLLPPEKKRGNRCPWKRDGQSGSGKSLVAIGPSVEPLRQAKLNTNMIIPTRPMRSLQHRYLGPMCKLLTHPFQPKARRDLLSTPITITSIPDTLLLERGLTIPQML